MIIRALQNFYLYYGDNFKVECRRPWNRAGIRATAQQPQSFLVASTPRRSNAGRVKGVYRPIAISDTGGFARLNWNFGWQLR